jgi:hypothetical protein
MSLSEPPPKRRKAITAATAVDDYVVSNRNALLAEADLAAKMMQYQCSSCLKREPVFSDQELSLAMQLKPARCSDCILKGLAGGKPTKVYSYLSHPFLIGFLLPLINGTAPTSLDALYARLTTLEAGLEKTITKEEKTTDVHDSKDAAKASMDARQFIKALVTRAAAFAARKEEAAGLKLWKELQLIVCPDGDADPITYGFKNRTKEQLLEILDTDWGDSNKTIAEVVLRFSNRFLPFSTKDFSQKTIDEIFNEQRLSELEAMLKAGVQPLRVEDTTSNGLTLVKTTEDLVDFHPSDVSSYFATQALEPDKTFAVVVAGESGSGKSVFSCLQTQSKGYTTVYCVVTAKDLDGKPNEADFPLLNELLRLVADTFRESKCPDILYNEKQKLNRSRNEWAERVLQSALKTAAGTGVGLDWLQGDKGLFSREERPQHVAIILDEATDIDLVEGLLAKIRTITISYQNLLARENLLIVLTGTGLDTIRETGRVGTNPAHSRLVILKSPNIKTLKAQGHISETVSEAMNSGIFSRVMQTNARMLFRAVLPILNMKFHTTDEPLAEEVKTDRLRARLEAIASFKDLMDLSARVYLQSNSVGQLSQADRVALVQRSFVYHLVTEMENAENKNLNIKQILENELADVKTWDAWNAQEAAPSEIFERGLVCKSGTSNALKYLSCFGQTCTLRSGFGSDFEELVALHYLRSKEVQGFTTKRHILRHGWPPASVTAAAKIDEATIAILRETLSAQAEKEEEEGKLKRCLTDLGDKACVVFSQGTATAQGGDVLALVVSNGKYRVDSIQCKNVASSPGPVAVRKWWQSLGIEMKENNEYDLKPTTGSAGYSYAGLKSFCELLSKQLGRIPVHIGQRVIATSFKVPPRAVFPIPTEKDGTPIVNVRVWFGEMLEPTISVLSVNTAVETTGGS